MYAILGTPYGLTALASNLAPCFFINLIRVKVESTETQCSMRCTWHASEHRRPGQGGRSTSWPECKNVFVITFCCRPSLSYLKAVLAVFSHFTEAMTSITACINDVSSKAKRFRNYPSFWLHQIHTACPASKWEKRLACYFHSSPMCPEWTTNHREPGGSEDGLGLSEESGWVAGSQGILGPRVILL